jgi:hypothetical protein
VEYPALKKHRLVFGGDCCRKRVNRLVVDLISQFGRNQRENAESGRKSTVSGENSSMMTWEEEELALYRGQGNRKFNFLKNFR